MSDQLPEIFDLDSWLKLVSENPHNSPTVRRTAIVLGIRSIAEEFAAQLDCSYSELTIAFFCYMKGKKTSYRTKRIATRLFAIVDRDRSPNWRESALVIRGGLNDNF